ncbi:MAG: hypothetical protein WAW23_05830, partial [Candidatus Methanoperedens sp.]
QSVLYTACSEGFETCLDDLLIDIRYGTAQKCSVEPIGAPVLRIPNITDNGINHEKLKYCTLEESEMQRLALRNGDLLMIRSNGSVELLGKTALVTEREQGFAYAGYLMRLRVDASRILPAYLNLCLRSQECRDQIEMPARSTSGVNNINSQEVRSLSVMIPALPKQRDIVLRVARLFALADAIEKQVAAGTARVEKLTHAILAKAFRGELVPTEAELVLQEGRDHEPASVLLDRIKTERERIVSTQEEVTRPDSRHAKRRGGKRMHKSELISQSHLADILRKHENSLQPSELWKESGLDIDSFYAQLKLEIEKGAIIERVVDRKTRLLEIVQ